MKTIDITFDLETCALCPNAAVMSVGAVAWLRDQAETPFFQLGFTGHDDAAMEFSAHVDLRGMFVDGFTFDPQTAEWWSRQSDDAKSAVLAADDEDAPCAPIEQVVSNFIDWLDVMKGTTRSDAVNLWSQGTDFDVAIMRNICYRYGLELPVNYKDVRDHRTFYMEGARTICDIAGVEFEPEKAYTLVDRYEGKGEAHDPVYDCKRSIWSTWQMMRILRCLKNGYENNEI